ncbi:hypothetical protein H5410_048809 [Solanum commersonii]|uniref:Uncharacterized protein n=1 Tax=Solanum commersonii TaxID=4109 RepID=A0A9J5XLK9_SOLCO|nr:hypothetical protein H5410_048809 [Solanum commersonii]
MSPLRSVLVFVPLPSDKASDYTYCNYSELLKDYQRYEGFNSLADGEAVEFDVESGNDGRTMAFNVIGLDGALVNGEPSYAGGGLGGSRWYGGDGGYGGHGGRYGGGGGGRGGSGCYMCVDDDHFSRKCSQGGGYGSGGGGKYDGMTAEAEVVVVVTSLRKKGL